MVYWHSLALLASSWYFPHLDVEPSDFFHPVSCVHPCILPSTKKTASKGKYVQLITFVDGLCTIGYRGVVLRFWFGHDIGMIPLPLQPIFPFIWNNYIYIYTLYNTIPKNKANKTQQTISLHLSHTSNKTYFGGILNLCYIPSKNL